MKTSQNKVDQNWYKLTALLPKLHGPNKGGLGPFWIWIKCNKAFSWCFQGSPSLALTKTCTTS